MSWDNAEAALASLRSKAHPFWGGYLGFYSSWLDGYFNEPWAMSLPLDDHGFHRGDAVFEAARIYAGAFIDLDEHLERLARSAAAIGLVLPKSLPEIKAICVKLGGLCAVAEGALRLYVSRGPGGFSPSVKESCGAQIYAVITKMNPPSAALYAQGARARFSAVPAKEPFWARIKSCNYLPNVLMKKEALDAGVDFTIGVSDEGLLLEGATENMMLITPSGDLRVPKFDYTLRGTTVRVVMRLAEDLVREGRLQSVALADLHREDLLAAREAAFVGTTIGVLPMTEIDGRKLGPVGDVCRDLQTRLLKRMAEDPTLRTPLP